MWQSQAVSNTRGNSTHAVVKSVIHRWDIPGPERAAEGATAKSSDDRGSIFSLDSSHTGEYTVCKPQDLTTSFCEVARSTCSWKEQKVKANAVACCTQQDTLLRR